METVTLQKSATLPGQDPLPMTWRMVWANREKTAKSAIITCANSHDGALLGHSIALDGTVRPSCVCTVEDCGWHEMVVLADWAP